MVKHYLKTALRNLLKHKLFSFVNILGLGLGMACCFLIVIFVRYEFSFDQFQQKADRVGRVTYTANFGNSGTVLARIPPPIAPLMPAFFPEVKYAARMYPRSVSVEIKDGMGDKGPARFEVEDVAFADSNLLDILTFEFTQGDPLRALDQPFLDREGKKGKVVGVVKDFHYRSLRFPIDAFIMDVNPSTFNTFSIRIQDGDVPATLAYIESKWNALFPEKVFENTFLDETIGNSYENDSQFGQIISYFAFLAILISCFGLYGLVTYTAVQKTKEIGIRKVLGASIGHILLLLSKEFITLIIIAGLIASPMVYYGLQQWLSNFAFTINIGLGILLTPLLLVLLIALLTLSYQALKAAFSDPVKALRYE